MILLIETVQRLSLICRFVSYLFIAWYKDDTKRFGLYQLTEPCVQIFFFFFKVFINFIYNVWNVINENSTVNHLLLYCKQGEVRNSTWVKEKNIRSRVLETFNLPIDKKRFILILGTSKWQIATGVFFSTLPASISVLPLLTTLTIAGTILDFPQK